jgi:hypothetical protein
MGRNKDLVLARLSRSRRDVDRRNELVVAPLGAATRSILTVGAKPTACPALRQIRRGQMAGNWQRLAAWPTGLSLMLKPGSDNADDVSRINF